MLTKRQLPIFALYILCFYGFVEVKDVVWTVKCVRHTTELVCGTAHFSLNALSIRSTSTSRWNDDASLESNCSNSKSAGVFDDESGFRLDVSDMA